ncbi:PBP1A family penicillin-binding protein [Bacillus mangrovi]|uniref:PBP1A family penicillin-binding protein n=1 Tax=Metabacillus mangrovi TaxID=1491830 RepID=A0A7X2V5X1_9BACI|nr:PBP1A family penicillin-binding protein [Metabacillus mangrovi]MTH54629.1 PBP1A family penicillin-binding protein [Metabacillus mangrovi]
MRKKLIVKISAIVILISVLAGLIVHQAMIARADVSKLEKSIYQPTAIYDRDGKLASKLSSSKVEWMDYEEMPKNFEQALIATEDRDYYEHNGIDYLGIARAAYKNVTAGGVVEGGSTITQQLAKNTFLSQDQTFTRKFDEYFLAKKIEQKYSKENILELYANQVYFGEGAWGLKSAAQTYFSKKPEDLTVSESAVLVGLIKAPSNYSPVKNYDKSIERRNVVIGLMEDQKLITKAEAEKARGEELALKESSGDPLKGKYPSYVDQIIAEASKRYGISQEKLLAGGYKIYTELNQDMQTGLEEIFKDDSLFPESKTDQPVQAGSVLIDPGSGGIQALIGGRGEHSFRQFNRATQLKRQPGSILKPIAAYTPAIEKGYTLDDSLKDEKMDFGSYSPSNIDGQYRGTVSLYEAFTESYNVPAVYALSKVGIDAGLDAAKRFGIPTTENDRQYGLALGGLHEGVSPLQMAEAFSAFPNKGVRNEAHSITKIVDSEGKTAGEWDGAKSKATSEYTARKMTQLMLGTVNEGTGENAKIDGWELAGKTGSTQDPNGGDGTKDQWFAGYTPNLAGALWIGYDKTDADNILDTTSSQTAAPLYKKIMERALKNEEMESFNIPLYKEPEPVRPAAEKEKDESSKDQEKPSDKEDSRKKEQKPEQQKKDLEKKIKDKVKEEKKKWEEQFKNG